MKNVPNMPGRNDEELINKMDEALSSSYPRELANVERRLQGALDELTSIQEKHTKKEVKA